MGSQRRAVGAPRRHRASPPPASQAPLRLVPKEDPKLDVDAPTTGVPADWTGNYLLDRIPAATRGRLVESSRPVALELRQVLWEPGQELTRVHFPTRQAVVSLLIVMRDGATVEMASVGVEGMVGLPVFFGRPWWPNLRAIVQVAGEALVVPADVLAHEAERSKELRDVLSTYAQVLMAQTGQTLACNRLHPLEQRCSRWLLMMHDRARTDEFPFTQEFLADMLGVQRPTVTVVAGMLQKAGFIRYHRGRMEILNREGLESSSCECYQVIRAEFERLLPPPG